MNNKKRGLNSIFLDIVVSIVGCLIFSYAFCGFLMPNEIATGGVGGIASAISSSFHIKMGTLMLAINIPLLILAWIFLGKRFTINTTMVIFESSIILNYIAPYFPKYHGQQLLGTIFGSLLLGAGIAIIFTRGFTTGGTDIIGRLLQLKFPGMSIGKLMMCADFFIICLSAYIYTFGEGPNNGADSAMYGLITVFIYTKTIDTLLSGADKKKVIYVMSDKNDEIGTSLMNAFSRGLTKFDVKKVYSKQDSNMIMCIIQSNEISRVKKIIKSHDMAAFIMILNVDEAIGGKFEITNAIK